MENSSHQDKLESLQQVHAKQKTINDTINQVNSLYYVMTKNSKQTTQNIDKIKNSTKEFDLLFQEIIKITQSIEECGKKVNDIDKHLTEKLVLKNRNDVFLYEQKEMKSLHGEEEKYQ